MKAIPENLPSAPFTRAQAGGADVTPRMLRGRRFARIFPRVWRLAEHQMAHDDWVKASRLALAVHRELVALGYDGPAPVFGERWRTLFRPIRQVVGSRDEWLRVTAEER